MTNFRRAECRTYCKHQFNKGTSKCHCRKLGIEVGWTWCCSNYEELQKESGELSIGDFYNLMEIEKFEYFNRFTDEQLRLFEQNTNHARDTADRQRCLETLGKYKLLKGGGV